MENDVSLICNPGCKITCFTDEVLYKKFFSKLHTAIIKPRKNSDLMGKDMLQAFLV